MGDDREPDGGEPTPREEAPELKPDPELVSYLDAEVKPDPELKSVETFAKRRAARPQTRGQESNRD